MKIYINWTQEKKDAIAEEIEKWMNEPTHTASAFGGEGIMQNDNCIIDAPVLISILIDKIIKPTYTLEDEN